MSYLISALAEGLQDLAILTIAAIVFGVCGTLVSFMAHHVWFRFLPVRGPEDQKIADSVQTSLLAFCAFVLALSLTSALSNLSEVQDAAVREAADAASLHRELAGLGDRAAAAREAVSSYVKHVAADEWPLLAQAEPRLSPRVQRDLDRLWAEIRTIQLDTVLTPPQVRDALDRYFTNIDRMRAQRLAEAAKSIPSAFWIIIILFLIAASFMNGRNRLHRFGVHLIAVHMSAIGLVIALIVIVDNPFRGVTSVSPSIIGDALDRPTERR